MEVKNQAMDQLLVNTAAQPGARENPKAGKDAERPDFDAMVQRRTAEKDSPKAPKTAKPAKNAKEAPTAESEGADAQTAIPAGDEQYALAAALMMQVQPDARIAQIQPETIAAENVVMVEAVLTENAPAAVETAEPQLAAELVTAEPEAQQPVETPAAEESAEAQTEAETPAMAKDEAPVEARGTVKAEAKPEKAETPEAKPERTVQPKDAAQTQRAERPAEAPRTVRETQTAQADETPDDAQAVQAAPLFERVDAPVVKVAEVSRPVPLEAEDGVEQLGRELEGMIVNSADANRIEVTLTPEHLGKLTVEVTRGTDGTLSVVLHTTSERAANLLEKGVDGLRQALAPSNRGDVEVQVRPSEESQQQFLNPDGQNGQEQRQQQQQGRRREQQNAQDFLQQLRLGLVDVDGNET